MVNITSLKIGKVFIFKQILVVASMVLMITGCAGLNADNNFTVKSNEQNIVVADSISSYEIAVVSNNTFKVTYHKDKNNPKYEESFAVVEQPTMQAGYQIDKAQDSIIIDAGELQLCVYKQPFTVGFFDASGRPVLKAKKITAKGEGHIAEFVMHKDDRFFGMGQKSISVDRNGHRFGTTNIHMGGYTKPYATQQVNIPYVYSPVGYGVLFDNTWPGTFDFGVTNAESWSYEAENGSFTFYVTNDNNLHALQKNYYELTGYPPLPPKWSLGLLQSKCGYENEKVVDSIVQLFDKKQMPLDAIILDAYWFGGYKEGYPNYMGNFSWLASNFPDHKVYMKRLSAKGIKTILINEPYINLDSKNYEYLAEKGYLVSEKGENEPYVMSPYWAGDASMLDITNPGARDWVWKQFHRLLSEGVDGLWVDLTEPEYTIENGEFYLGPEKKVHNVYNNIFAETIYEGWRKDFPDKRVFNLTRAGFAGIQRYGAVNWSGDASKTWIALKLQVPMLIGCAMSGMPHFSSDIGGFTNAHDRTDGLTIFTNFNGQGVLTTPELYIRWFQFGVFSPMLRPHSGEEQYCEPFAHGTLAEKINSYYLNWRYRLIPYIYTYAHKTTQTSEQLIKPLFMNFNDAACDTIEYQYMFGEELMVAPVLEEGKTIQQVYFPKLENNYKWINFWNDSSYEGGASQRVIANLDDIPVFAKQPSVIPLAKVKKHVGESKDDTLTCRIYPGGEAAFELYEDDGTSYKYENGAFSLTTIRTTYKNNTLSIKVLPVEGSFKGMVKKRNWIFDIRLVDSFNGITLNAEPLPESEYAFDAKKGKLIIHVNGLTAEGATVKIKDAHLKK